MGNLAPFTLSVTAFLIVSLGLVYWLASSLYPHTPPSMVEDYIDGKVLFDGEEVLLVDIFFTTINDDEFEDDTVGESGEPWLERVTENHRKYADRHGYRYHSVRRTAQKGDGRGETQWMKLYVLREVLQSDIGRDIKWLFYVDMDVTFTNPSTSLHDVITPSLRKHRLPLNPAYNKIDFFFSGDTNIICSGALLLSNSEFTMNMLDVTASFSSYSLTNADNGAIAAFLVGCDQEGVSEKEAKLCYQKADGGYKNKRIHMRTRGGDRAYFRSLVNEQIYTHTFQLPQAEFLEGYFGTTKDCRYMCHAFGGTDKIKRVTNMLDEISDSGH
eukprot:m.95223 g.95223  ORF g.95223 m.95223 type:complete len:328 (-) comp13484_c0_seq2:4034-5017(-)